MFIPGDIYTSSGSTKLYHCWTDRVTKFDSSAFYNWEQENLPLYDLDERTHYLWEQLGHPTSSIPGIALVVSADAPASSIACNTNIFRTVSAAIEAIPKVVNYPILIEVANFGQLGNLEFNNIKFGPRGSIEIINRNFSRAESTVSSAETSVGFLPPAIGYADGAAGNVFYLSSVLLTAQYNAQNLITTPLKGFTQASCISISAAVFSSTFDARLSGVGSLSPKLNGYVSLRKERDNYSRSTLIVDEKNTINPYIVGDQYSIGFKAYDLNPEPFDDVNNRDASTIDYFNAGAPLTLGNTWQGGVAILGYNGLYYGNKVRKIVVNNCDGPIYIRNFFLDGSGADLTGNDVGVEINSSPNVYLENTVVTRFRKAGFKFTNSDVKLLRGCVATRIYDFDSSGTRVTEPFNVRRKAVTFNSTSGTLRDDGAAGILATNSTITFSSTDKHEYPLMSALLTSTNVPWVPSYYTFEFTKNTHGIILNNSVMKGGKTHELDNTALGFPSYYQTYIDVAHNVGVGVQAYNSKISLDGRFRLLENLNGMVIKNSTLEIDKFACIANQNIGVAAYNSNILYNKLANKFHIAGSLAAVDTYIHPIYFRNNGQHLLMNNTSMLPFMTSSMENSYGRLVFLDPIGNLGNVSNPGFGVMESIKLENNSNAVLISPYLYRDINHTLPNTAVFAVKGSELHVTDNSTATLRGTKYFATRIFGPSGYYEARNLAALCAGNNSTININGPTVIAQYGIDILAENNSKVQICPPRNYLDNNLDISSINMLDSGNHTAVELHSVRSCIVADKASVIELKDLGDLVTAWTRSGDITNLIASGSDYINTANNLSLYTSGGSLQFYPNPVPPDNSNYASMAGAASFPGGTLSTEAFDDTLIDTRGQSYLLPLNTSPLDFSAATYGGMCVRALHNSVVNVHNVNFPCGFWNPSAPYYDGTVTFTSGGACYKTFIWNIADNSQLNASHLSVSGLYPNRAGYVGPYGYWTSAASAANYGAPSSTPDTSSLSVLDFYGANPSSTAYSKTTASNYGPFRLYFSVDPVVNTLVTSAGQGYGIIPQIYSQGYHPSGNLICSGDVSALYTNALRRNTAGSIVPSGFYFGNEIVNNPEFSRVIVDQSAAETFANAKHCTVGKSNMAKPVILALPYDAVDYGDSKSLKGIGSLSNFDIERFN